MDTDHHRTAGHVTDATDSRRELLRIEFIVLPLLILVILIAVPFLAPGEMIRTIGLIVWIPAMLAAWPAYRRGRTRLAHLILTYGFWLGTFLGAALNSGLAAPVVMVFPILILTSSWLLGRAHLFATTALTMLAVFFMAADEYWAWQLLPPHRTAPVLYHAFALSLMFIGAALVAAYVHRDIRQRIASAQRLADELRLITENVPAMIFYGDSGMRCLRANAAYARFMGQPRERITGMHLRDIVGEEVFTQVRPHIERALRGEQVHYESLRTVADGEARQLEVDLVPDRTADGVRGWFGMVRDVTEQRRAEAALEAQRKLYEALIAAQSDAGIGLLIIEGERIIFGNDAIRSIAGFGGANTLAASTPPLQDFFDLIDPADLERVVANLRQRQAGAPFERRFDIDITTPAGLHRSVEISAAVMPSLPLPRTLIVVTDITERKRVLEELRRSEEEFATVFRASPVAITLSRLADGRYIDINPAFTEMFGWRREEVLGSTSVETGLWPSAGARLEWLSAVKQLRRVRNYETGFRTRDGQLKSVLVSTEIIARGQDEWLICLVHDITERKRAEDEIRRLNAELEDRVRARTTELAEANRDLEAFSYSVSHDLRAPLRSIDGFSHLIAKDYADRLDGSGLDYLDRVRRSAQRMGQLIDDLLELSRVGRQAFRSGPVDLSALAREIVEDLQRNDPQRVIEVCIEDGCGATGDAALLRVLLENLLGNAWKYTGKTVQPRIEFGRQDGAFFVGDNGAGFDMQYAGKLFSPFQRMHKPSEFEGTGVGLASVARIVRRHDGRIWAEAAPGAGATFRFTLPAQETPSSGG